MSNISWEHDDTNIIGVVTQFYSQNFTRHFDIFYVRNGLYFHEQMHPQSMQALFLLWFDGNQRL